MSAMSDLCDGDQVMRLGAVEVRNDIRSSLAPFHALPEYRVRYPDVVVDALCQLYMEYNQAFAPLVEANREWEADYRHCIVGDLPKNLWVQIDMVGLPQHFLDQAPSLDVGRVREMLRGAIFEIENSLAMYQLLERICGRSEFCHRFRSSLDAVRRRHNMPIALLAVTQEKYGLMMGSEFGRDADESISDDEVFELTGFDRFFGPDEFRAHVAENAGGCRYLLYVRSSDPVLKLKKPDVVVEHPLLSDPQMRSIIKSHALTFSVDDPLMDCSCRINDTKAYLGRKARK
jgi:hypothetical protein